MNTHEKVLKWGFTFFAVYTSIYAILLFTGIVYDDTWTPKFFSYLKFETAVFLLVSVNVAMMFFNEKHKDAAFWGGKVFMILLVAFAYFKYQVFYDEYTGLVAPTYYDGMGHNVTTFYDYTDMINSMKYTYWFQLMVSLVTVLYINWVESNQE
jgi:hypothetical protein